MNLSATDRRNLRTLLLMSVFEPESIAARLAKARDEAGLTQEELGDLVGLSTRMVQHYEAGTVVPYKHLRKFAEVLGRDVGWLLHGDPPENDATDPVSVERFEELSGKVDRILALLEPEDPQADQDSETGS